MIWSFTAKYQQSFIHFDAFIVFLKSTKTGHSGIRFEDDELSVELSSLEFQNLIIVSDITKAYNAPST